MRGCTGKGRPRAELIWPGTLCAGGASSLRISSWAAARSFASRFRRRGPGEGGIHRRRGCLWRSVPRSGAAVRLPTA
eukprot:8571314-Heterocapsa_arctica.AAC.1